MNKQNQCACQCGDCTPKKEKVLKISWQRLISDGNTCPRCGSTEDELEKAQLTLEKTLSNLGIKVELEKIELNLQEFKTNPVKSNSIFFNGIALEDLLGAKTGKSQCCDVCGDEECRTVELGDNSFESIPAEIIVKAGLIAAAMLVD